MRKRLLRIPYKNVKPGPPRNSWHETQLKLNEFWTRVKYGDDRMGLLREYADYRMVWPQRKSYEQRREIKHEGRFFPTCFVCKSVVELCRHHIIQLQHGGSTASHNVVRICGLCHAEIHPWLWRTPQDMTPRLVVAGRDAHGARTTKPWRVL